MKSLNIFLKRTLDVLGSGAGLILLSPFLLVVAILVRIKLGSPIFFRQQRPGLNGKPFMLVKFRTMTDERGDNGNLLPDEVRLTRFGQFLRSTSIDELPELWNVFVGDMSLVGPRPLRMHYLDRYSAEQWRRHHVRPGITGWAQVNGRNAISWEDRFKLDVWYVDNWTPCVDLKILMVTIFKVLKREGIAAEGTVTMKEFRGTEL